MVFYLAVLWTCARTGSLRLVIIGVIAAALFAAGLMPSFPPTPAPAWRSEVFLAALVAGLAVVAFMLAWTYVAGSRAGGGRSTFRLESLIDWASDLQPSRRRPFATAAGAHFWYEWRASGTVLPALVAGVVILILAPVSWLASGDARYTVWILIGALATPIVLALPVGVAFSKPVFWSEDMAVPAFVAVRPMSSQDLVAIKVKVASASAALSWLIVLGFLAMWLPRWANLDLVSRLATRLFAGHPAGAVYSLVILVPIGGVFLTWRSLVSHLWSGLSGMRPLFLASVFSLVALVTGVPLDAGRLMVWLLRDPSRFGLFVSVAIVAVIAKSALTAYAWRGGSLRYVRAYVPIWLAGTASVLTLGMVVWGLVRVYLPFADRLRVAIILLALLTVPIARVALTPSLLARNRHR